MPFRSEKQRRFMWAQHPEIAKRWAHEMKTKGEAQVQPSKKKKKGKKKPVENDNNFRSEKQRKFLWWKEPAIAEKWAHGQHSTKGKNKVHKMPSKALKKKKKAVENIEAIVNGWKRDTAVGGLTGATVGGIIGGAGGAIKSGMSGAGIGAGAASGALKGIATGATSGAAGGFVSGRLRRAAKKISDFRQRAKRKRKTSAQTAVMNDWLTPAAGLAGAGIGAYYGGAKGAALGGAAGIGAIGAVKGAGYLASMGAGYALKRRMMRKLKKARQQSSISSAAKSVTNRDLARNAALIVNGWKSALAGAALGGLAGGIGGTAAGAGTMIPGAAHVGGALGAAGGAVGGAALGAAAPRIAYKLRGLHPVVKGYRKAKRSIKAIKERKYKDLLPTRSEVMNTWSDAARLASIEARRRFAGEQNDKHEPGHHAVMADLHREAAASERRGGLFRKLHLTGSNESRALLHDEMAKLHQAKENDPHYHREELLYHQDKADRLKSETPKNKWHLAAKTRGALKGGLAGAALGAGGGALAVGSVVPVLGHIAGGIAGGIGGAGIGTLGGATAAGAWEGHRDTVTRQEQIKEARLRAEQHARKLQRLAHNAAKKIVENDWLDTGAEVGRRTMAFRHAPIEAVKAGAKAFGGEASKIRIRSAPQRIKEEGIGKSGSLGRDLADETVSEVKELGKYAHGAAKAVGAGASAAGSAFGSTVRKAIVGPKKTTIGPTQNDWLDSAADRVNSTVYGKKTAQPKITRITPDTITKSPTAPKSKSPSQIRSRGLGPKIVKPYLSPKPSPIENGKLGATLGGLAGAALGYKYGFPVESIGGHALGAGAGTLAGTAGTAALGAAAGHLTQENVMRRRANLAQRSRKVKIKKYKPPATIQNKWSDEARAAALAARKAKFAEEGNTKHQFDHHARMAENYTSKAATAREAGNEDEAREHEAMAKMHIAKESDPKYHKAESEYHFREESKHKIAALHPGLGGRAAGFITGGATGARLGSMAGGAALSVPGALGGSVLGAAIGAPLGVVADKKFHALRSNLEARKHAKLATKHLERATELGHKTVPEVIKKHAKLERMQLERARESGRRGIKKIVGSPNFIKEHAPVMH